MNKLDTQSFATVANRLEELRQLFPSCFTESENGLAVDFDQLRSLLSVEVDEGTTERYRFTWPGKRQAIANANARTSKTLRPVPESSVDFERTKNLYIEGDNLDALKLLLKSYRGQVNCIYIDPPYNTGNDFVYQDDFKADAQDFALENGDIDDVGNRMKVNKETDGRYHTNWLNMMYPRLILARDLLAEDGVIFISIDEHEIENLEKICDEIFGETNKLGELIWDKRNPKGEAVGVSYEHESILVYCRNKNAFRNIIFAQKKEHAPEMQETVAKLLKTYPNDLSKVRQEYAKWVNRHEFLTGGERAYKEIDDLGRIYQPVSMAAPDKPETRSHQPFMHPFTGKPCPVPAKGWRYKSDTMECLLAEGLILFGKDESVQPRHKYLLSEHLDEAVCSVLRFGGKADTLGVPFSNPKPLYVIQRLLYSIHAPQAVVLDFFSGSATTAHAVMQLNAEDGGQRQFIMVQLPEDCDENLRHDPNNETSKQVVAMCEKLGLPHVLTEMGKERIRRAGAKIKAENPLVADQLDTGFRVLRIDSSNINESIYQFPQDLQQGELEDQLYIKEGRTPEDLLFQTILNLGLPLSVEYTVENLNGQRVFNVGSDHLIACFDDSLSLKTVTAIAQKTPNYAIFLDSAMDDSLLANIEQVFKTYSAGTDWKVL